MLRALEIIHPDAAATSYQLMGGAPFYRVAIDGIGIPQIQRRTQEFANDHGALDYGYRLEPREITLKLFYQVHNDADEVARRDLIYKIFQPLTYPMKLRATRWSGNPRQIDCYTIGVMDLPESERMGASLAFAVRLLAPNPIWYEPVQYISSFTPTLALGGHLVAFPYGGGWEEYPVIKLYGSLTNPYLSQTITTPAGNVTNFIDFTGHTISAGAVYTLDLRPGYKTVVDGTGANKIAAIANIGVSFTEFRLFQVPIVASTNNITLGYSAKDGSAKIELFYYHRFLGI